MPFPLIAAAIGSALGGIATGLINKQSQEDTNAAQAATNERLYQMQRADAVSDWNRNNAYNSPAQQMQRFKEAGLNPNLIYGNMQNAQPIRSVDAKAPDYVAPRLNDNMIPSAIGKYMELKQQDLTIKNQEKALALTDAQTKKVEADAQNVTLQNQNLIDQSPYILEEKFQTGRLRGQQVNDIMQNIENKKILNPLQQDKVRSELQTMSQSRLWQNLTNEQQIATSKAIKALTEAKLTGQNIENTYRKYEYDLQNNLGINKNTFSDLLKIGLSSFLK